MGEDITKILNAAAFAARKHSTQRRKDRAASPYINHPLALAAVLSGEGGVTDADVIIAALLHDTVEDTATTLAELDTAFGARVAAIVAEVTDDKALPKAERKRLQIVKAPGKSPEAKVVKLADKICNLRDIASDPPAERNAERKSAYFAWAKAVVAGLRGTNPALEAAFDAAFAAGHGDSGGR